MPGPAMPVYSACWWIVPTSLRARRNAGRRDAAVWRSRTDIVLRASCFVLRASWCFVLRGASCFVLRAEGRAASWCFVLRASCFVLRAEGRAASWCFVLRASCFVLKVERLRAEGRAASCFVLAVLSTKCPVQQIRKFYKISPLTIYTVDLRPDCRRYTLLTCGLRFAAYDDCDE
jgi:hypothetical protein